MTVDNLQDLYLEQLRDLYNAETQLIDSLSEMMEMASNEELTEAFREHLEETREQKERLEGVFRDLGEEPTGESSEAIEGLIRETEGLAAEGQDPDAVDAALITQAQRAEHYEIAGYGTVRTYAEQLDRDEDVDVLNTILEEEKTADQKLTGVAEQVVNPKAATV